jgi:hypothetical protein
VLLKWITKKNKEYRQELNQEKLVKKYLEEKAISNFSYTLPEDKDYNSHKVEVKIPELDFGYYIILASTSAEFSYDKHIVSYCGIWNSNIAYSYRKLKDGSFDIDVMHRQTGEALANVTAQVYEQKYDYKSRKYKREKRDVYQTNSEGKFNVPYLGENNYSSSFYLDFTKEKDKYCPENNFLFIQTL